VELRGVGDVGVAHALGDRSGSLTVSRLVTWDLRGPAVGLVALTIVRLLVAAVTPLAPDEAYYWVWSRALAGGYFDHPPMVALWIRIGTALVGTDALGVRLLGPLSAAVGSVLLYDAAERLFPGRRAGLTAPVLLNATLALNAGAVIMTPDTPLLLFWTATLWAGARVATGGVAAWWLAAGLFAGLALDSKYTAAFLPIGLGVYVLLASPGWLRRREVWLGVVVMGLLFLPVVVWNWQHDWVGFLRQGGRVSDWRPERAVGFLGELVAGQIGLATPGVAVLFVVGIVVAVRLTALSRDPAWTLLAALSVPPGLVFLQHALGDRVQGNWPVILYPAAAIAASGLSGGVWRRVAWPSSGLGFVVAFGLYLHAVLAWPLVSGDPVARQLFGWDGLAVEAEAARQAAGAAFIVAEPYGVAAELAWGLPVGVVGVGPHWELTTLPRVGAGDRLGVLVRPERYGAPDPGEWGDVTRLPSVDRAVGGANIERYAVFLVRVMDGVVLPHR
jgi:4-amino-4-deoxy-L-arabinose transferase-like glycosyltransferase